MEPGVPARGLRRRGHAAPGPPRRRRPSARRTLEHDARGVRARARRGHPGRRHRLRDRRAGQGRRQRVPRHQDLLHQRDGRGLRGHRRRRHEAVQGAVLRRPHRRPVPARRPRLRRRLPAQGHPRVHGPGRRARRRPGAVVPARRSTRSTCAAAPAWSTWPASCSAASFAGARVAVLGAAFKPNTDDIRDSPGPRRRRRPSPAQGAAGHRLRPAGDGQRPAQVPRARLRELGDRGGPAGADVVLHLTEWQEFRDMDPATRQDVVAAPRIVDGRNALDPAPGAPPAGPTAPSAAPELRVAG